MQKERFRYILFMGNFEKPPVAGAMFYNGLIHNEKELWSLLNRAKVVIEVEHATPCRRCYYRKYLRLFKGYKFLLMWDYVTRRNFLKNYVNGYDRIFSVHACAEKEIRDRWGHPATFWPHGYETHRSSVLPERHLRYDIGFCGFLGERPGWEQTPIYDRRREVLRVLKNHFGDRMVVSENLYGEAYNYFWNQCKIGINCSPLGEATLRVYEILATNIALVTDDSSEIQRLFEHEKHLLMYNTPEEAVACCERLLADETLRRTIAWHGHEAVVKWERSRQFYRLAEYALRFLADHPLDPAASFAPLPEITHAEPVCE